MKIIFRVLLIFFLFVFFVLVYLSLIGVETKRFNSQIIKKIEKFDKNLEIELNEIKMTLDPLKFKIKAKTIAPKFKNKNKILEIESIDTEIPLKSFFNKTILIKNLNISTKSLLIKDLISFIRMVNNNPELYFLEKITKKGFLIADIELNFDEDGNIKNDYKINGLIRDTKISILNKYEINKLDLNFQYEKKLLSFQDIKFALNNQTFYSKTLDLRNTKDGFKIDGEIGNEIFELNKKNFNLLLKPFLNGLDLNKINLSSKNKFSFELSKKFKIDNFYFLSKINLEEFIFINNLELKEILPELNKQITFSNHEVELEYKKKVLTINGTGKVLLQKEKDDFIYSIKKDNKNLDFKTSLLIKKNPFKMKFLDYEKVLKNDLILKINGIKDKNNKIELGLISIKEKKNKFEIKNLVLNKNFKITDLKNAHINYLDNENNNNKFEIKTRNKEYFLTGSFFNANNLIEDLTKDNENKSNLIDRDFVLNINLEKVFIDKGQILKNLNGKLLFNDQKIIDGNLVGKFSNNKRLEFTVQSRGDEKITTLFLDRAEVIVNRYKFIKGFEEGLLDFYSLKKGDISTSTIKIYDFKLKELPALTKLLTLASLQGIADLLSGEGIRFNEFEMNFRNKNNLITIDEIYAIGPAISILMNGYVEKNKLVNLRGTLVPATTINKVIGSIPILGQILVGSKTGEGVFGVSFKIKGPPKKLETTVNPIKSLTPRFITRTLEKLKKTN